MSATATMTPFKPPSHSHSHSRSSRPSTTPRAGPATSPGTTKTPLLSPSAMRVPETHNKGRAPSPSYFGLLVGDSSDPPDSNPGKYARQNWEFPQSQARSAAPTPRALPVEANREFDAFRKQSESSNRFNLSHGNLSSFSRPSQSRQGSSSTLRKDPDEGLVSPRTGSMPSHHKSGSKDMSKADRGVLERRESSGHSYFDQPRAESPGPMDPRIGAVADHQHARLSLPSNRLQTPPVDAHRSLQRAETLPLSLGKDNPTMVTPQQFAQLAKQLPTEILLLDLRVYPQYAASRIHGALNLCIPTTLLKRPSFTVQKLGDTFTAEADQEKFATWKDCQYIVLYDANSAHMKDAGTSVNVIKKFATEGWNGQGLIIRGGFTTVVRTTPDVVDKRPVGHTGGAAKQVLTIESSSQGAVPVAGGCQMPATPNAANPFFGNIRQNMDLMDGVGQMPIKRPSGMPEGSERALPRWLRDASNSKNDGKVVSDRFLAIEKAEQKRMQDALSGSVSYGSPRPDQPKKVQIAGIEKGSKNRYNNIFPYDHSRVKLQGVPREGCDYVNANYVKARHSEKEYIATQAPIPATFNDFWRVVWEQDASVIVMLTAESEGGQIKSHPYWHAGTYGSLKLKSLSEKRVSLAPKRIGDEKLSKRPSMGQRRSTTPYTSSEKSTAQENSSPVSSEAPSVVVRHFTLSHSSYPFQRMREVTQLHYSNWPDFGAPTDPRHLLALIEQTNKYVRSSSNRPSGQSAHDAASAGQRPVVVHCSAGCGRTGTFCTIDSVIDMLKRQRYERYETDDDDMDIDTEDDWVKRDDVDLVAKTVEDFRRQRLSMVQNLRQFVLCYEAILQWVVDERENGRRYSTEGAR